MIRKSIKHEPLTACISHCWQRFASVRSLGCLVLPRPQSAPITQQLIHANVMGKFKTKYSYRRLTPYYDKNGDQKPIQTGRFRKAKRVEYKKLNL